jgi:hypothetical protein
MTAAHAGALPLPRLGAFLPVMVLSQMPSVFALAMGVRLIAQPSGAAEAGRAREPDRGERRGEPDQR